MWGIYLDGGQSGVTSYGNIIGATLHGAIFDNAGGNNTHVNNVFISDTLDNIALLDFGTVGASKSRPSTPRSISGSLSMRNIFYWRGSPQKSSPLPHAMASQNAWTNSELKTNGSDFNLYWARDFDLRSALVFPGSRTFAQWQGSGHVAPNASTPPLQCGGGGGGTASTLILTKNCTGSLNFFSRFRYNATSERFSLAHFPSFVLNIDCDGNWANCALGTTSTKICLQSVTPWTPTPPQPPAVDNQGWKWGSVAMKGHLVAVASGKCLEVCERGGAVGGCDGKEGSIAQLAPCVAASPKQHWSLAEDGTLRTGLSPDLCLTSPPPPPSEATDSHSTVAEPMFVDALRGDYRLAKESPAYALGFEAIPAIEAPTASCGGSSAMSCLAAVGL